MREQPPALGNHPIHLPQQVCVRRVKRAHDEDARPRAIRRQAPRRLRQRHDDPAGNAGRGTHSVPFACGVGWGRGSFPPEKERTGHQHLMCRAWRRAAITASGGSAAPSTPVANSSKVQQPQIVRLRKCEPTGAPEREVPLRREYVLPRKALRLTHLNQLPHRTEQSAEKCPRGRRRP